jgi:hypothetical protein
MTKGWTPSRVLDRRWLIAAIDLVVERIAKGQRLPHMRLGFRRRAQMLS